ncbi:MAG TPA: tetratricopeptide repeat protein [Pyrinomonadaceae bacterium]|jgi:tetratricopeptide (TPR) repeat protein|nr:tetratricopeptide repeat protein [Pyrinomonadaceae bacterium]
MKYRATILTTVTVVLLFCLAATTYAQGHTIRGKIRNSLGSNVGRASVTLERNGVPVEQTVSNNEGDFNFNGLTDTSYTIIVVAPDYDPASESVEFVRPTGPEQPGESRTVELMLTAKGGVRPPRAGLSFVQDIPQTARAAFDSGIKLARENHVPEALSAYEKAIAIFPDYFDAHLVLANELAKQAKFPDAIKHLDEARRVNPKDDRIYDLFARVMMQQHKYAVAARIYAEAATLNSSDGQYLLAQGTALVAQGSIIDAKQSQAAAEERAFAFTEAERVLLEALKLNKKLADAHLQLARLYEKRGERPRAANELEQYLRLTPNVKNADAIRQAIKTLRTPTAGS